jgi:signal transduction histidine kinase
VDSVTADEVRLRLATLGEIAAEAAHELRSVLQVISSSAYVARCGIERGDTASVRMHLDKVENGARTAHGIVDDLLALARAEPISKEVTSVRRVLDGARAHLPDDAARWEDIIAPPDLHVLVHPGLFERLFHALYENSVLATAPRPPAIVTRARLDEGRAVFEVEDDGPGIAAPLAQHVFEPLVTTRHGGTGLGLALARRIALAHGGSIALLSDGAGARFRIEVPG